jgi:hypothetical protein
MIASIRTERTDNGVKQSASWPEMLFVRAPRLGLFDSNRVCEWI